jgi:hypothetical protein
VVGLCLAALALVRTFKLFFLGTRTSLPLFLVSCQLAASEVVTLIPSHDTTLMEIQPDRNNGGQGWVNAGTTQNVTRNHGLFQWDLTEAIPFGSTILSATVTFDVTRSPGCGIGNSSFSLYRVFRPWGEGDKIAVDNRGGQGAPATGGEATWNDRFFGDNPWGAPGGLPGVDFAQSPSASQFIYDIGRSPYTFSADSQLVDDVQGWVNDSKSNFGWILISDDETTPFTARRFGSREDPDHAPLLTVEFQVVPEPAPTIIGALGLVAMVMVWRRRRE